MRRSIGTAGPAISALILAMLFAAPPPVLADRPVPILTERYDWHNVSLIAGGFISGIDYSPAQKNLLYVRTDIGGAYRWDASAGRFIPLEDWLTPADWNLYGVESIGVDPVDANRVYLATGTYTNDWASNGAILRSDDQGRSWQRTDLPFKNGGNESGRSTGERLAVDPLQHKILFFGTRDNGLWRSTDFGGTWNQVKSFPILGATDGTGVDCLVFDPTTGSKGKATASIYACVSQKAGVGLYHSADAGDTWQPVPGQPAPGLRPHHAVLTLQGILYITYANDPGPNGVSNGAVWKLDTKTGTWTDISPAKTGQPQSSGYAGLAVDFEHPNTLMVSTMDRWNPGDTLFRSIDGGLTWEDIRPTAVLDWSLTPYLTFGDKTAKFGWWIGTVAIDPFRPGRAMYGTGATIWTSGDVTNADSGQPTHWTIGALGIEETAVQQLLSPPTGAHLFSSVSDISAYRHDDLSVSPRDGMLKPVISNATFAVAAHQPMLVVRTGDGPNGSDGAISTDGGKTWTLFATQPAGTKGGGPVAISPDGHSIVWSPKGAATSVSHDNGATWSVSAGAPQGLNIVADDAGNFYGLSSGRSLYVSTDKGATFSAVKNNLAGDGYKLTVPFGQSHDLWLTSGQGIFRSTNGGVTFKKLSVSVNVNSLGFGKAAPGRNYPAIYLTGSINGLAGVYRSDDTGVTWILINDKTQQFGNMYAVTGDPRIYGRVYTGTNGRGIFYADPANNLTR